MSHKQTMCDIYGEGDVYIVKTSLSIFKDENIYKIGRAASASERLKHYPKGSKLILQMRVSRMKAAEDVLKDLCRQGFTQWIEYGAEYYKGDIDCLIRHVLEVARMFHVPLLNLTKSSLTPAIVPPQNLVKSSLQPANSPYESIQRDMKSDKEVPVESKDWVVRIVDGKGYVVSRRKSIDTMAKYFRITRG